MGTPIDGKSFETRVMEVAVSLGLVVYQMSEHEELRHWDTMHGVDFLMEVDNGTWQPFGVTTYKDVDAVLTARYKFEPLLRWASRTDEWKLSKTFCELLFTTGTDERITWENCDELITLGLKTFALWAQGNVVMMNPAQVVLFTITPDKVVGRDLTKQFQAKLPEFRTADNRR